MTVDLFLRKNDIFSVADRIEAGTGASYELEERLDAGGNGVVYKCLDAATGNEFAVKFLLKEDRAGKRLKRFKFEVEQLENLDHDHLVKLIAKGSVKSKRVKNKRKSIKNIHFYIMELADAGNLKGLVSGGPIIKEEIYKPQFRGLAKGLKTLHDRDIIHRDIKPENVLINGERWILADFGLCAPLTRTGKDLTGDENLGPRFWMSPEMNNRCLGLRTKFAKIGKASDIFQLASVFWYIVNKRHPSGIIEESDWGGKKELFPVLKRALEHCPNRRTSNAEQFLNEIEEALI